MSDGELRVIRSQVKPLALLKKIRHFLREAERDWSGKNVSVPGQIAVAGMLRVRHRHRAGEIALRFVGNEAPAEWIGLKRAAVADHGRCMTALPQTAATGEGHTIA